MKKYPPFEYRAPEISHDAKAVCGVIAYLFIALGLLVLIGIAAFVPLWIWVSLGLPS